MMKSRPSAIKLRLSRIIRFLVALGCLKLAIMGVALLDLPMPSWGDNPEKTTVKPVQEKPEPVAIAKKEEEATPAASQIKAPANMDTLEIPQGSAAAELASYAKPRASAPGNSLLPAPLTGSLSSRNGIRSTFTPNLPTPAALGAPLAKAGVILPVAEKKSDHTEDSIWDMLDIKSLPIPGLGSAQAAHAAALDMPVPNLPGSQSPFTPAEQIVGNRLAQQQAGGAPGASFAPPSPDGAPLPPRSYTPGNSASQNTGFNAPVPNIPAQISRDDPAMKSQELARQQQDILMLRNQMDQRLKELQTAEDKMKDMLREAKNVEDNKIRSMVQMYANMKPRMAAQALEKMDERVAVRILSGMAPKQSGEILTYTNPSKTAKFTEMIARLRMQD